MPYCANALRSHELGPFHRKSRNAASKGPLAGMTRLRRLDIGSGAGTERPQSPCTRDTVRQAEAARHALRMNTEDCKLADRNAANKEPCLKPWRRPRLLEHSVTGRSVTGCSSMSLSRVAPLTRSVLAVVSAVSTTWASTKCCPCAIRVDWRRRMPGTYEEKPMDYPPCVISHKQLLRLRRSSIAPFLGGKGLALTAVERSEKQRPWQTRKELSKPQAA